MYKKSFAILLMILMIVLVFSGCAERKETGEVINKTVFLENQEGTYTKAEIIIPVDFEDEKLPLVTLGHGFRGNLDSAGGNYLAESLAESGIATIRMDYSHYKEKNSEEQTNQYTVETMAADQLLCIKYMEDTFHIDTNRIGLYGRSLGGRVAMAMANESAGDYDYKALALVAPAGTKDAFIYYIGGGEIWKKKSIAREKGSVLHQNIVLTPEFFDSIEKYTPSDHGEKFEYPVLVVFNTEDYVVLPETSLICAAAYKEVKTVEITSEKSPHGYEMGFEQSEIKDRLIGEITEFFRTNL